MYLSTRVSLNNLPSPYPFPQGEDVEPALSDSRMGEGAELSNASPITHPFLLSNFNFRSLSWLRGFQICVFFSACAISAFSVLEFGLLALIAWRFAHKQLPFRFCCCSFIARVRTTMRTFVFYVALFISGGLAVLACAQTPSETGLEGVITIGPIRPGPIHPDTPLSKPLPNIEFVAQNDAGAETSFITNGDGRFRVLLAPGHYTVSRKGPKSAAGYFGPFSVDVAAGKMTTVEWTCDSGMR